MVNADLPTPPPPTITNLYSVILNVCLCVCLFVCLLFGIKKSFVFILFPAPSLKGFTSLNGLKIKKITLPPPELNKITQEISSYLGKGKTVLHLGILPKIFLLYFGGVIRNSCFLLQLQQAPSLFFPNSARHVNIPFFLNLFIFTICVKCVFFSTNKTKFY